jgi:malonyl CoA-acyl carrier protein transacylase
MNVLSFVDMNGEGNDYVIAVSESVDNLKQFVADQFADNVEWVQDNHAVHSANLISDGGDDGETIYKIEEVDVV